MLDACSQVDSVSSTTTDDASDYSYNGHRAPLSSEVEPEFLMKSARITAIARRELAAAIRDLAQHGLFQVSTKNTKKSFKCVICFISLD
jgi:hypothetical protein